MEYIISLSSQARGFLYSLGFGVLVGILYDGIRIIRLTFTKSKTATAISDILFVIIAGVATFIFFLSVTYGEVRLYAVGGELLGFLIYYFSFGVIAVCYTEKTVSKIKAARKHFFAFLFSPLIRLCRFCLSKVKIFSKKISKMSKKRLKIAKYLLQKYKYMLYNQKDRMSNYVNSTSKK